jgi:hypothetical protein
MEKKTFDLCLKVLKKFEEAQILSDIILIGSWSVYFYKAFFNSAEYSTFIRTRDMDFLVPIPYKSKKKVDIFALIKDLGFIEEFKGSKGYIKLVHPDLAVEFLVPEKGKGHDKPYPLPQLGVNAQPLRYLGFLVDNTISIEVNGLHIKTPHPAAYALHKFIIFKRRKNKDKHDRDIEGALRVFRQLIKSGRHSEIRHIFKKVHKKWQDQIIRNLRSIDETEVLDFLEQ